MPWYYALNGVSHGPVEEAQIQSLHQQNIVTQETPVWTEGMAEWLPFQASALSMAGSVAIPSATRHQCAECSRLFPEEDLIQYEQSWVCAACKSIFFQRIKEGVTPKGTLVFATIGRRFLAVFIDGIIIDIVLFPAIILLVGFQGITHKGLSPGVSALVYLVQYLVPAAYEIILIGAFGATLGKMAMKIKVVTPEGRPVSYGRATGRYFAKMLSGIILCIGYLMAFWDDEKRALHDRICKTRVIAYEPS
jgi:uncharacterized RDD family membrane protein YckC